MYVHITLDWHGSQQCNNSMILVDGIKQYSNTWQNKQIRGNPDEN